MPNACTSCDHPQVDQLNRALADGLPVGRIARQYGLVHRSVQRHKTNHLAVEAQGPTTSSAGATAADQIRKQIAGLESDLATATSLKARTDIRREIRLASQALGGIEGPPKPEVVDITKDPDFVTVMGVILGTLERHPEALADVRANLGTRPKALWDEPEEVPA